MAPHTLEERAEEYKPAYEYLEGTEEIRSLAIQVGGPMEFDPAKGEVMIPDCVEFAVDEMTDEVLSKISKACDWYGLRVIKPDHKQPGYTYMTARGEETNHRSYEVFVRLVEDR